MRIIDFDPANTEVVAQAAQVLLDAFREFPSAWTDLAATTAEVKECMAPDRISRVAVDDDGNVLGWVGAINIYNGNVWDLHPLAVRPDRQRQGIGRALIEDMAEQAKARGGCTLWVGSEDHGSQTSLGGANLYPDLLARLAAIEDLRDHPYGFYLKAGFHLAGVLPDACGPGQPDIFLARSL